MTNKSIHSKLYHRIIARLRAKREEKRFVAIPIISNTKCATALCQQDRDL